MDIQSGYIDTALAPQPRYEEGTTQRMIEERRHSEIMAMLKPIVQIRLDLRAHFSSSRRH